MLRAFAGVIHSIQWRSEFEADEAAVREAGLTIAATALAKLEAYRPLLGENLDLDSLFEPLSERAAAHGAFLTDIPELADTNPRAPYPLLKDRFTAMRADSVQALAGARRIPSREDSALSLFQNPDGVAAKLLAMAETPEE